MTLDTYFSLATLNVNAIHVGKDVGKMEPYYTVVENVHWKKKEKEKKKKKMYIEAATMKNSMEGPKKLKIEPSYDTAIPPDSISGKNENYNLKR